MKVEPRFEFKRSFVYNSYLNCKTKVMKSIDELKNNLKLTSIAHQDVQNGEIFQIEN